MLCEEVAIALYKKLEYLYTYGESNDVEKVEFREPRGTLLIVDRTIDLVTPLIHDYTYQSTVYDYLDILDNGSVERVIPPQPKPKKKDAPPEEAHILDSRD